MTRFQWEIPEWVPHAFQNQWAFRSQHISSLVIPMMPSPQWPRHPNPSPVNRIVIPVEDDAATSNLTVQDVTQWQVGAILCHYQEIFKPTFRGEAQDFRYADDEILNEVKSIEMTKVEYRWSTPSGPPLTRVGTKVGTGVERFKNWMNESSANQQPLIANHSHNEMRNWCRRWR